MNRRRLSIRGQLMILYILVVVAVCMVYLPMSNIVRIQLVDHHKRQTQQLFERNLQSFDHSVSQLYAMPEIMKEYNYYRESVAVNKEHPNALPKLYMASQLLSKYLNAIPLVDKAFVLFTRSESVIDDAQLYIGMEEFAEYGLAFEDGNVYEMLAVLNGSDDYYHLRPTSKNGSKAERSFLMLMSKRNSSIRIGAVYNESTLAGLFNLKTYPAGTQLVISNGRGETVFSYGEETQDHVLFSGWTSVPHVQVKLTVPEAYFDTIMSSYDNMLRNTLFTAVVVGVLLSVILTAYNYRPIKKLMHRIDTQFLRQTNNEYDLINEYMQSRDCQLDALGVKVSSLRSQLRSHLFARLLNGALPANHDKELAKSLLPELEKPHCLAVIYIHTSDPEEPLVFAPFDFLKTFDQDGIVLQISYHQAVMLLKEENLIPLEEALMAQQGRINEYGLALSAGISGAFVGVDEVCIAYHQAELAVSSRQIMRQFSGEDTTGKKSIWNLRDLQRMYDMLLAGEISGVENMLRGLQDQLVNAKESDLAEIYSLVSFVFVTVQNDLLLESTSSIHARTRHMTAEQVINNLCEEAYDIGEQIQALRKRGDGEMKRRVIEHIHAHFTSPLCCAENIAVAERVSTNTVYQIVREQMGCSLGEYIEQLRLNQACELLENSDIPVAEVGEKCGWPVAATFYRAFKRGRGMTPNQYRKKAEETGNK